MFIKLGMKGPALAGLIALSASTAFSQTMTRTAPTETGHNVGVGVAFEGAAGLSVYADTAINRFVQGTAAWGSEGAYLVTGDYAFAYHGAFPSAPVLTPYWGIGGIVLHDTNAFWPRRLEDTPSTDVGFRIPLGLSAVIPRTPVQVSGELVPTLIATPASYSYLQGGVSARVLF